MEDEISYVIEGRVGVRVGDEVAEATPGSYIYKPCGVPHTFWNPTDEATRLLEIISPAGFEEFFVESEELFETTEAVPGGPEHGRIARHYYLSFFDDWTSELKQRFNLKLLGEP